jgi:hypothetical protein
MHPQLAIGPPRSEAVPLSSFGAEPARSRRARDAVMDQRPNRHCGSVVSETGGRCVTSREPPGGGGSRVLVGCWSAVETIPNS